MDDIHYQYSMNHRLFLTPLLVLDVLWQTCVVPLHKYLMQDCSRYLTARRHVSIFSLYWLQPQWFPLHAHRIRFVHFWLCQVHLSWNPNCWKLQRLVHLQLIHRYRMKRLGHRCCPVTNCYRWPEILLTVFQHLSMQFSTVTISRQTHLLTQPQNAQNECHVPT